MTLLMTGAQSHPGEQFYRLTFLFFFCLYIRPIFNKFNVIPPTPTPPAKKKRFCSILLEFTSSKWDVSTGIPPKVRNPTQKPPADLKPELLPYVYVLLAPEPQMCASCWYQST